MPPIQYHSQVMDHLGLVAGMCKELGIADHIDRRAPKVSDEWNISHGEAVVAMIINGLGFTGQSLHMFPQFFSNKPLDKLIREGIEPEHINDKVLGRTLDELFELGVSKVYFELAIKVATHLKLPCDALNLDGTGFHVDGRYNSEEEVSDEDLNCIRLCKGYSRDHRPDLNQAILLLLTENRAGIPMFMKAASGNVTDKTSFKQVVSEHIKSFKAALNARYFIGDAALYVAETVQELSQQDQLFISRVPLNIGAAKELVQSAPLRSMVEVEGFEHYESVETLSDYAGVVQRWVLFRNNQSQKTEQKTLTRRMQKKSLKEFKELEKLGKKPFCCESDAMEAFKLWQKQSVYCQAEPEIIESPCYKTKGRPADGTVPDHYEYYVTGSCTVAVQTRRDAEASLGCFVLATNDTDTVRLDAGELLRTYKSQQQVERGFRFLKSPDFLVSSLYLKKPERIEALLMVMTLCLMVYAAIQHRIRYELKRQSRTFPDMKKKPAQNPTGRWVFLCFDGIHVLSVNGTEKHMVGISERQSTIIFILGSTYQEIYS
ncbi:IS1634 family transposase [Endozoicomonas euniceicola]|uniref:IS1634 family transposase n=1 Tax=Endozoicomonas euniceicola TaxID=1234143 RepID=A0ABY6GQ63_9GAMM|nr:IS1634 family transposase [Endozoicomonas euniceicola]UYM14542.1 IS1634 family transposase [Endozoicomonas euniceicola]UYM14835.1 IS1634 family transposase [Endozoicomonas euniceicola]UYM15124.1 IS1634 family transposase [Endozoicomonas euniceicola]UYM16244.1 IS1634 family transposase [Endozoicomonas euniceicola]UYM16382.1 IS1634 family transposase [Endozoicomonas euniceicola]